MIKKAILWILDGLSDFWHEFTSTEVSYGFYIVFKNNVLDNIDKNVLNNTIKEIGKFSKYGYTGFKGTSSYKESIVTSILSTKLNLSCEDFEVSRSDNYFIFIR